MVVEEAVQSAVVDVASGREADVGWPERLQPDADADEHVRGPGSDDAGERARDP